MIQANAKALMALLKRSGGDNPREQAIRFEHILTEAVRERKIDVGLVLLEEVARVSMGERWKVVLVEAIRRGGQPAALLEEGQPVTSDFFSAVTGQVIYSTIREAFSLPDFVFSALVPTIQSGLPGTETVPEITPMGDVAQTVEEAQEYPQVGIGAATTTLPASAKNGMKIALTEEAMSFTAPQGLTSFILGQASAVGKWLGYRKELSLIDVIIGYVNNYIRNGTGTNTYLTSGAYINNQTSAELVDYTDVDSAEQLLAAMVDPTTGIAIMRPSQKRHLIVSPARELRARAIVESTGINVGDITTGTGLQTTGAPNPLRRLSPIEVIASRLMINRIIEVMETETTKAHDGWFYGDLAAFFWKEIWPLAVFQATAGNQANFDRDIGMQWKARYHGVAGTKEPRIITRNENSVWG